jgi:hypothetical protein
VAVLPAGDVLLAAADAGSLAADPLAAGGALEADPELLVQPASADPIATTTMPDATSDRRMDLDTLTNVILAPGKHGGQPRLNWRLY